MRPHSESASSLQQGGTSGTTSIPDSWSPMVRPPRPEARGVATLPQRERSLLTPRRHLWHLPRPPQFLILGHQRSAHPGPRPGAWLRCHSESAASLQQGGTYGTSSASSQSLPFVGHRPPAPLEPAPSAAGLQGALPPSGEGDARWTPNSPPHRWCPDADAHPQVAAGVACISPAPLALISQYPCLLPPSGGTQSQYPFVQSGCLLLLRRWR